MREKPEPVRAGHGAYLACHRAPGSHEPWPCTCPSVICAFCIDELVCNCDHRAKIQVSIRSGHWCFHGLHLGCPGRGPRRLHELSVPPVTTLLRCNVIRDTTAILWSLAHPEAGTHQPASAGGGAPRRWSQVKLSILFHRADGHWGKGHSCFVNQRGMAGLGPGGDPYGLASPVFA